MVTTWEISRRSGIYDFRDIALEGLRFFRCLLPARHEEHFTCKYARPHRCTMRRLYKYVEIPRNRR